MKSPLRVWERELNKKYAHLLTVEYSKKTDSFRLCYKGFVIAYWLKGDKKQADRAYCEAAVLLEAIEIKGLE